MIALWITGSVVLLIRYAVGLIGALRLVRRASVARDTETYQRKSWPPRPRPLARVAQCSWDTAPRSQSPIMFGVAKPFLLLPDEAMTWSGARRRAVLVHEAAHVARGDCLSQAIGRLACALLWFHPLVWRALAQLRHEAERAADDGVLNSGVQAFDYASQLLDLARRANTTRLDVVAVGIVTASKLELRFISMFDRTRSRAVVTSRVRATTMAFALVMSGPLASLRVATSVPRSHPPHQRVTALSAADARHAIAEWPVSTISPAEVSSTMNARTTSLELPVPPLAVVGRATNAALAVIGRVTPARTPIVHPNFSGKWKSDTSWLRTAEFVYSVTDSLTLRQTDEGLSIDGRGHMVTAPWPHLLVATHNVCPLLAFDGVTNVGFSDGGGPPIEVFAKAVWEGDTLVITTDGQVGTNVLHTVETMSLSPDGQTLLMTNVSSVNGRDRWGKSTGTMRRMNP